MTKASNLKHLNSASKANSAAAHWDLTPLYQSPQDPQIKQDLDAYQQKRQQFAEKYQQRSDYLQDEDKLWQALNDYEQLLNELNGARPLMYFHYLTAIDSSNQQAQAQLNYVTTHLTKAHNQLAFFPIKLGKIDPAYQHKFLNSNKLKRYRYLLQRRFTLAQFDLAEEQERILNLTQQTGHQMWVKGVEKSLHQHTIKFKNQKLALAAASQKIPQLPTKPRRKLQQKVLQTANQVADFAESEINAIITHKQIEDELRGYDHPYQATILAEENKPEIVLNLVDLITKHFSLAHRFYRLKAKLLNLKQLQYADRAAKLEKKQQHYSYQEAFELVANTLQQLDPDFAQILHQLKNQQQIDVYPRQGKIAGAFCSSSTNNPTYVLLNHTNDFNSVTTMAHEVGHAIHSELSKSQPVIYQAYSSSTAETASTFFEQLVFQRLIQDFSPQQKIAALHNKIQDDINTVFRQIALFNFEQELHQAIKEQGALSAQQIGQLLNKHMQAYLGDQFKLTELDGRHFILWSHIRRFFYTYTYAYGHLISQALVRRVQQQSSYIDKVKRFLSAGGSNSPQQIFSQVGIDISQPLFFKTGLKQIEADIEDLETMV